MARLRRLEFVPRLIYLQFCNVLHIILWTIRAILTYRVYRLYDEDVQYKLYLWPTNLYTSNWFLCFNGYMSIYGLTAPEISCCT